LSGAKPPLHLADIKESHDKLPGLTNHELAEIPVVREGEHLQQWSNYIDLAGQAAGGVHRHGRHHSRFTQLVRAQARSRVRAVEQTHRGEEPRSPGPGRMMK
jgi:hypothetical protein